MSIFDSLIDQEQVVSVFFLKEAVAASKDNKNK